MITKTRALRLYEQILLIRKCEEAIREHYHKDEMKTPVHLCVGSEAIAVGVLGALPTHTKVFGTYRNHGLYLTTSNDTDSFFGEMYGRTTGSAQGKAGSMHLTSPMHGLFATSAVVGTTIPVAVGAAFANQYRGNHDFVVSFFGDGAMEEGVFWESLNFACLHKLRILFVCEDNDLAIHTKGTDRRGFRSFQEGVSGFNCYVAHGKGVHVGEVLKQTEELVTKMTQNVKPIFLSLTCFRFLEHVGIHEDFKAGYRKKPSAKRLRACDPVYHAERFALKLGAKKNQLTEIQRHVNSRIKTSVQRAEKAPFPQAQALTADIFTS